MFLVSSRVVYVVRNSGEHRLSLICRPPVFLVLSARGIPWKLTIDPRKSLRLIWLAPSRQWRLENAAAAVARDRRYDGGSGGCAVEYVYRRLTHLQYLQYYSWIWDIRDSKPKWKLRDTSMDRQRTYGD